MRMRAFLLSLSVLVAFRVEEIKPGKADGSKHVAFRPCDLVRERVRQRGIELKPHDIVDLVVWLVGGVCFLQHLLVTPLKDIHDLDGDAAFGGSSLAIL